VKVLTTQPVQFQTGDILPPEDLNHVFLYARDAVLDVTEKRFTKSSLTFPFVVDMVTPYGDVMTGTEELIYRFICPTTCVVLRGFLNANMVSSAEVQVNITRTLGGSITGLVSPWLSTVSNTNTTGAIVDNTVITTDINVDRFVLNAGDEYQIAVSSTGTFSLNRFDVTLDIATDRWCPSGTTSVPDFNPTLMTDASGLDPSIVNNNVTALTTTMSGFVTHAPAPMLFVKHGLVSGTDINLCQFHVPRFLSSRAVSVIRRLYVWCFMSGTGGSTVSAILKNAAGTTITTASVNMSGLTHGSGDSGNVAVALHGAATDNASNDFTVLLNNVSGGVNAIKIYALLWVSRQ
jgi:hypothetical protein